MGDAYDIKSILKILPHRYPFVMVDRILELDKGERVLALKNVTINEPFFQGHFPGDPIMPGVMILEAMGQAGGVLFWASLPPEKRMLPLYFVGLDKAKFRKPVRPGDQLTLDLRIINQRLTAVRMAGRATVDGQLVAEAEMLAATGDNR